MSAYADAKLWRKKAKHLRAVAAAEKDLAVKAGLEKEAKQCDREAKLEMNFAKMEAAGEEW